MDIKMKVKLAKSVFADLANLSVPPALEDAEIEFSPPKPLWASEEDDEESEDQ